MLKSEIYRVKLVMRNPDCRFGVILMNRIQKFLTANGHRLVNDEQSADYIIVSSCAIFSSFENESLALARKYTRTRNSRVILLGCVSRIKEQRPEQHGDILFLKDESELNGIFAGEVNIEDIGEFYSCQSFVEYSFISPFQGRGRFFSRAERLVLSVARFFLPKDSFFLRIFDEIKRKNKYFVEISRGCVGNCSYCIEKIMRPRIVSRTVADILDDISHIYHPHIKLCLAGDDCGAYGLDIKENIFDLVRAIESRFPDIDIELCNMYPFWIERYEKEYIELIKNSSVNSINIPIQSGSPAILSRMNRRYSISNILRIVKEMKRVSPGTMFWTHILAGFPGETRLDFKKSLRAVGNFDFFHSYLYSEREGTRSVTYSGKVPEKTKVFRGRQLLAKRLLLHAKRFGREVLRFRRD
jgi:tRNA A37 methylthiotransferase MiaB